MPYSGESFGYPFHQVGLNHNPNIDLISTNSMVWPSRNINIHEAGVGKRGGTAKVNSTVVTGTPRIMAIKDFRLHNANQVQVFFGKDGKLYNTPTTTIATGLSTSNFGSMAIFKNKLYFVDGANQLQEWDGAAGSTSAITNDPVSWTGSNFPNQVLVHSKRRSKRLVGLVLGTDKEDFYLSALDDATEWKANNLLFNVRGDQTGYGITGGFDFKNNLFLCTRRKTYIFNDDDLDYVNWGVDPAPWEGGAAHWRLIVPTFNDVIIMTDDGVIYSVASAQATGDFRAANLTRKSFIDRWIRDFIDLSKIDNFHAVFDPVQLKVKFFMTRLGSTNNDVSLDYFIDRPLESAWVVHDNQDFASGYDASASAFVQSATGTFEIYTGDFGGFLWKLEQANKNDDGNGYWAGIRTANSHFGNPRIRKHYKRGKVITTPQGDYDLSVRTFIDGTELKPQTVSLAGAGGIYDTAIYGGGVYGGDEIITPNYPIGAYGERIQSEFSNNIADQDFFLSQNLIDHRIMGAKPRGDA